jgi:hypothetical protein
MYPIKKRLFSIKKHYRASFNAALGKTNPKNRQGPRRLPEHQKELGSDPLLSGDIPGPAANLMIYMNFFDFKSKSI